MLFQVIRQSRTHRLRHRTSHLRVTQLGFRLSLELRFSHLHGNNGSQTFTEVIPVNIKLQFTQCAGIVGIRLQRLHDSPAEAGKVSSTLHRVDIIHVREHVFLELRVIMHSHLDRDTVFLGRDMNGFVNQFFTIGIQILHELAQPFFRIENFGFKLVRVGVNHPFIRQRQTNTPVQISQFPQTGGQYIIFIFRYIKDRIIRLESNRRTGTIGFTDNLHVFQRHTFRIFLKPNTPFPVNRGG